MNKRSIHFILVSAITIFIAISFLFSDNAELKKPKEIEVVNDPSKLELLIQNYHTGIAGHPSFSPDGKYLAVWGFPESSIKVLETKSGRLVKNIYVDIIAFYLEFSHDGNFLLSKDKRYNGFFNVIDVKKEKVIWEPDYEKRAYHTPLLSELSPTDNIIAFTIPGDPLKIYIAELRNGKTIMILRGYEEPLKSISYSPNGEMLLALDESGDLFIWETSKYTLVRSIAKLNINGIIFSNDSKRFIVSCNGNRFITFSFYLGSYHITSDVSIKDIDSSKLITMGFSDDIFFAVEKFPEKQITFWNLQTGKAIPVLDNFDSTIDVEANLVLTSKKGNNVFVFNPASGKLEDKICIKNIKNYPIISVDRYKDKFIAITCRGGVIFIWDVENKVSIPMNMGVLPEMDSYSFSNNSSLFCFAEKYILGGPTGKFYSWDFEKGKFHYINVQEKKFPISDNKDAFSFISYMPSSCLIAYIEGEQFSVYSYKEGSLKIVKSFNREFLKLDKGEIIKSLTISQDGKFAGIITSKSRIRVININNNSIIFSSEKIERYFKNPICLILFSPDSNILTIGSIPSEHINSNDHDKIVMKVSNWDIGRVENISTFEVAVDSSSFVDTFPIFDPSSVKYIDNLDFVISGFNQFNILNIESKENRKYEIDNTKTPLQNLAMIKCSGNKDALIYGSYSSFEIAVIRKMGSDDYVEIDRYPAYKASVAAITNDGKYLALREKDNRGIEIWDIDSKIVVERLSVGKDLRSANFEPLSFLYNDKYLLVQRYAFFSIWDWRKQKLIISLLNFTDGNWIVYTPDGYFDCSPEAAKYVTWKVGDEVYSFDQYWDEYYVPDLLYKVLNEKFIPGETPNIPIPPKVEIVQPKDILETTKDSVSIEVKATDDVKVDEVVIALNGRPITKHIRGGVKVIEDKGDSITLSADVALQPGENTITVYAYDNRRTRSEDESITVTLKGKEEEKGNLYVLAIGISNYKNKAYKLDFAADDAEAIGDVLKDKAKPLFEKVSITALTDKEATTEGILEAVSDIQKKITMDDVLVIFLAGHGAKDKDYQFYFVTYESDLAHLTNKTAMGWKNFQEILRDTKAKNVIMMLDTCHSGDALDPKSPYITADRLIGQMERISGVIVLSSSTGSEYSIELPELKHGVYTYAVVEALKGKADIFPVDKRIFMGEMNLYVPKTVEDLTAGRQTPSIPRLENFTDFPIAAVR